MRVINYTGTLLILVTLFFAPTLWLVQRWSRRFFARPAERLALATLISLVVGYVFFWIYFFSPLVGRIVSWSSFAGVVFLFCRRDTREVLKRAVRSKDLRWTLGLICATNLFHASLLFRLEPSQAPELLVQAKPVGPMANDNVLPILFAEKLYHGIDPRPLVPTWQSSDRPPLQTGVLLWFLPLGDNLLKNGVLPFAISCLLQSLWPIALLLLGREVGLSRHGRIRLLALGVFSTFFFFNTVFTWPKLLAGSLCLIGVAFFLRSARRGANTLAIAAGAVAFALAMLAHGGSAFFAIAFAVLLPLLRIRFTKLAVAGVVAFSLFLPWVGYQKFYEPPGNRLVKWHIGGAEAVDERSVSQTLRDSYSQVTWNSFWTAKWSNARFLFTAGAWPWLDSWSQNSAFLVRRQAFYHAFYELGILLLAVLACFAALFFRQRLRKPRAFLLGLAVLTTLLWISLLFFGNATIVASGPYGLFLLWYVIAAIGLESLPARLSWAVVGWRALFFLVLWLLLEKSSSIPSTFGVIAALGAIGAIFRCHRHQVPV